MKDKKVKKLIMEAAQEVGRECIRCINVPMPTGAGDEVLTLKTGKDVLEAEREGAAKDVLETKREEAAKNDILRQRQKLKLVEDQYEVLNQYKKELDKERKARKRAEERQKEMMHSIKDFSKQLKEMEKKHQERLKMMERNYQAQGKEMEKKYQKLKIDVRKKARKQKEEIALMKCILKTLAYKLHVSHCGATIKEIAKDSKRKMKKMS